MRAYETDVQCENGHTTTIPAIPTAMNDDGVVTQSLLGSSADFCDVCDGGIIEIGVPRPS